MRRVCQILVFVAMTSVATGAFGQGTADVKTSAGTRPPATIFRDHDGNLVSNNEFVEIRMANFNRPDATIVNTLADGTIEFRLQRIPQEGMFAPDFTARTLDGRGISSNDLRGKVVVLSFWFTGCAACNAMIPKLNTFRSRFAAEQGVEFVAITNDPAHLVKRYVADTPFDYRLATDAPDVLKRFAVSAFPANVVIGKDGRIVYWRTSIHAWDKFESIIRTELAK